MDGEHCCLGHLGSQTGTKLMAMNATWRRGRKGSIQINMGVTPSLRSVGHNTTSRKTALRKSVGRRDHACICQALRWAGADCCPMRRLAFAILTCVGARLSVCASQCLCVLVCRMLDLVSVWACVFRMVSRCPFAVAYRRGGMVGVVLVWGMSGLVCSDFQMESRSSGCRGIRR